MNWDEIRNLFAEDAGRTDFQADLKKILSQVHLIDGMDFASHLFHAADCDYLFELPETHKPKCQVFFGRVTGLEEYMDIMDETVQRYRSPTEFSKILDRLNGVHNGKFAHIVGDKIFFFIQQVALQKGIAYASCLLSERLVPHPFRELCGIGILELLRMTIAEFYHQSQERHKMLYEKLDCLRHIAGDLKNFRIFGVKNKAKVEQFTNEYAEVSKQLVIAQLLVHSLPLVEEIGKYLEQKVLRVEVGIESLMPSEPVLAPSDEAHPKKFKLRPDVDAVLEEAEPLKYQLCHDGIHVYGGTLLGSGFIDFTAGVTLPCEISGKPVTEFSGTYQAEKLQHIEAWCVKRVNLKLQGEAGMVCKPPLLYGGMQNTVESVDLTFEAPTMHFYRDFQGRKDITHINFSGVVTEIADWDGGYFEPEAFKDCTNLKRVNGVFKGTMLPYGIFENCTSLVSAPKLQVKKIADYAFVNASSLTSVFLPDGLESIASGVFAGCSSLEDLYIPDNCLQIGRGTFKNCTSLKTIHLPSSLEEVREDLFSHCESLTKVFLADGIVCIGNHAFYHCKALKNPWIPQSIKRIGENAFYGCVSIESVTIPAGIEEIGENAFGGIPNLVIKGYAGTVAETYAKEHGISFVSLTPNSGAPSVTANYDLSRFTQAHKEKFEIALSEIKNGKKESHWMWYIFPQIVGLGKSSTSAKYAIGNLKEAKAFLDDEYLGGNLKRICQALLELPSCDAAAIFGDIDTCKLKSSMTLFLKATDDNELFQAVLDKFFHGEPDGRTLGILRNQTSSENA